MTDPSGRVPPGAALDQLITVKRDVVVVAYSLLSLLWHRYVPRERKDDLALEQDVNRTIAELRDAYEHPAALDAPLTAPGAVLDQLIAKWRGRAKDAAKYGVKNALQSHREYFGAVNAAFALAKCADELERLRAALDARPPNDILKDAAEIRSSYGFLLMRLAVAKDAQDTYDVCKREFTEHEAAFQRLGIALGQEVDARPPQAPQEPK